MRAYVCIHVRRETKTDTHTHLLFLGLRVHVRLTANKVCLIASCCSSARGKDKDVAVVQHRSKIVLAIFIPGDFFVFLFCTLVAVKPGTPNGGRRVDMDPQNILEMEEGMRRFLLHGVGEV